MPLLPPLLAKHKGALVGAAVTVLLAAAAAAGHRGVTALVGLQAEQHALEQKVVRLQRANDDMRTHLERMRSDREYLERVVRQRLGWVEPGEIVYRVSP
jgi:cell division protein FtsB